MATYSDIRRDLTPAEIDARHMVWAASLDGCNVELAADEAAALRQSILQTGRELSWYREQHPGTREAILNIQTAAKRIALVWEGSQNDELADAQAELEQAVRFLTGEEEPS